MILYLTILWRRKRGVVEAILTIAFHSRLHSTSEYTKPACAFKILCWCFHRRHNASLHELWLRNPCKALRKVSKRSWNPHIPAKIAFLQLTELQRNVFIEEKGQHTQRGGMQQTISIARGWKRPQSLRKSGPPIESVTLLQRRSRRNRNQIFFQKFSKIVCN